MEHHSHPSSNDIQPPSIFITFVLAFVLVFIPGLLVSGCFGFYAGATGIVDMGAWFNRVDVQMAIMLFSLPISATIVLMTARHNAGTNSSNVRWLTASFEFLHLKPCKVKDVTVWILWSAAVWVGIVIVGMMLELPEEPFMLMVRDSGTHPLLIVAVVCVLAPIVEEMIFRGLLFKRFELSRLATSGSVFMTCLLFTLIHAQQYTLGGLFVILLIAAYLTFVRVKTQNTSLAIAAHATNNTLSTIALYHWI